MFAVLDAAAHPPAGAIVFVTVYVPGVLAARFTSPVEVFANTSPAGDELKVPALEPTGKVGVGLVPVWQYGPA